jgi:hypothetical protein
MSTDPGLLSKNDDMCEGRVCGAGSTARPRVPGELESKLRCLR